MLAANKASISLECLSVHFKVVSYILYDIADNLSASVGRQVGDSECFMDRVSRSVKEVFTPMLSSVLTTCSVFLPLIFLSGTAGALFYDQAMGITTALFASLLVATVAIPVYYVAMVKPTGNAGKRKADRLSTTMMALSTIMPTPSIRPDREMTFRLMSRR